MYQVGINKGITLIYSV